jgi:hypothetical protein
MPYPIVGQPTITDFLVTLQVKCTCGQVFLLAGTINSMRACPGKNENGVPCNKLYRISMLMVQTPEGPRGAPVLLDENGNLEAGLGVAIMPRP